MNSVVSRTSLAAVVALAPLALPQASFAHANLVATRPANGAVLAHAPRELRITFDDRVTPGPGIEAVRNGGGSILRGRARVVGGKTLVVPLRSGLAEGDYSVRWTILSDDGHLESGVVAFAVGAGRAPPRAALAPVAAGPGAESVLARWVLLAGVLGAAGIALFALVVLRGRPDEAAAERIALVLASAAVLAGVGAGNELHRVGLDTRDGRALVAGFVAAIAVATLAGAATLERRALMPALVLSLGLTAVPSVAGHALDPGLARVNVAADVLHVGGAAAWAGVLVGLLVLPADGLVARRAAGLALAALPVLVLTGVLRASYELLSPSQLWSTGYGRALLVKTGMLVVVLALGWLARAQLRRRAGTELALLAGLLVVVAVLVQLRPGRNAVAPPAAAAAAAVSASEPSPQPPPPPAGALVLAREAGPLAVALEIEPRRLTAIVLSPAGGGLSGLDVRFLPSGAKAAPCGSGCYAADVELGRSAGVEVRGFGATRLVSFSLPERAPAAGALVVRARRVYRALAGVAYRERLASDETHVVVSDWRLERPNRVAYSIPGGAAGIVIGARRWDHDGPARPWRESPQTPLSQPATQWQSATNARVVARTAATVTVAFADPTIPAFFRVELDRRSLLPRVLHMTAAAHFMTDRYTGFSAPRRIHPPR